MYYLRPIIIYHSIGNNAFVYDERKQLFGKAEIVVPAMIEGTVADLKLGDTIVFAEKIDGELREFVGLEKLVCIRSESYKLQAESWYYWDIADYDKAEQEAKGYSRDTKIASSSLQSSSQWRELEFFPGNISVYVMDNHNHALYCWYREYLAWRIAKWLPLIHIDQHSDMKDPIWWIDMDREHDLNYIAIYTNEVCTIADFIQPALHSWLVGSCQQIRTENGLLGFSLDTWIASLLYSWQWRSGYILDIDIDFWATEMGIVEFDRTIKKMRQLIAGASMVTIATSPCFIDQERAVEIVRLLLSELLNVID